MTKMLGHIITVWEPTEPRYLVSDKSCAQDAYATLS